MLVMFPTNLKAVMSHPSLTKSQPTDRKKYSQFNSENIDNFVLIGFLRMMNFKNGIVALWPHF